MTKPRDTRPAEVGSEAIRAALWAVLDRLEAISGNGQGSRLWEVETHLRNVGHKRDDVDEALGLAIRLGLAEKYQTSKGANVWRLRLTDLGRTHLQTDGQTFETPARVEVTS